MRLAAPVFEDQPLDLVGQLVGIAHRPARAIAQRLQPLVLVAIEYLVAGLARDAELPAHLAHAFSVEKASHETKTLFHHRTLSPRHQHLPPKSEMCYAS